MRHLVAYVLLAVGVCFIGSAYALAQDGTDGDITTEYAGSGECRECHRGVTRLHNLTAHARTLIDIAEADETTNPILADFTDSDIVESDVAYTLGVGRNVQAYITLNDNGEYEVLPQTWHVATGEWMPLELDGDDAYLFGQNCAGCHTVNLDVSTYEWAEDGVMCESCHGPGMAHIEAADRAGGVIDEEEYAQLFSTINLGLDSATCAGCHAQGIAGDGVHPYPVDGEFDLVAADDEAFWFASGHARTTNMQFNEWEISGHENSLDSALESDNFTADCMECHTVAQHQVDILLANDDFSPETIDPLSIAEEYPYGITCASCHVQHVEAEPEIVPAGATYDMCVSCHYDSDSTEGIHHPVQEIFEGLQLVENVEPVAGSHFTATEGPTCTTCHMTEVETKFGTRSSHTFDFLTPVEAVDVTELDDSCTICHDQTPAALQAFMDDLQAGTRSRIEIVQAELSDDGPEWTQLALSAVANEGSDGIHNYAYTDALLTAVEVEIGLTSTTITDEEIAASIGELLPDEPADTTIAEPPPEIGGLRLPSFILLVGAVLLFLFATFSFFSGERDNNQTGRGE